MELSDYYLHRVITSWLQVGAVFVAAAALVLSMIKTRRDAKRALTAVAHEGFLKFVELSARYPELYQRPTANHARRKKLKRKQNKPLPTSGLLYVRLFAVLLVKMNLLG